MNRGDRETRHSFHDVAAYVRCTKRTHGYKHAVLFKENGTIKFMSHGASETAAALVHEGRIGLASAREDAEARYNTDRGCFGYALYYVHLVMPTKFQEYLRHVPTLESLLERTEPGTRDAVASWFKVITRLQSERAARKPVAEVLCKDMSVQARWRAVQAGRWQIASERELRVLQRIGKGLSKNPPVDPDAARRLALPSGLRIHPRLAEFLGNARDNSEFLALPYDWDAYE